MANKIFINFEDFVEVTSVSWFVSSTISYLAPKVSHTINLKGSLENELPETVRTQRFDNAFLTPIANSLDISLLRTAELLSLRNAWIAHLLEYQLKDYSYVEMRDLPISIALDHLVLSSSLWHKHLSIKSIIDMPEWEHSPAAPLTENELGELKEESRKQWLDVRFCIDQFQTQKNQFTSFLEADADSAEHDIKLAKTRILELQAEIDIQEANIRAAIRPIRELKKANRSLKKRAPGRPEETEATKERSSIAKGFVANWIDSLMATLSISSCGDLATAIGGQKMTWWRWKNRRTLPSASQLQLLLNATIKSGEHKGTKIINIQTYPPLRDLITLVNLV